MADKSFGVKDINLIGASGTPEIESPNNLNIKATNVAISTDMSVGGELTVTDTFLKPQAVGLGTTTATGRDAGITTATGTVIYIPDTGIQVYSGDEGGWKTIDGTSGSTSIVATSSNAATPAVGLQPGNGYVYHTFTGSGTLTVTQGTGNIEYLIIGGGGAGGGGYYRIAGAGGAGGLLSNNPGVPVSGTGATRQAAYEISPGQYTITVGGGGAGGQVNSGNVQPGTASNFYPTPVSYPDPTYLRALGGGGGAGNPNPGSNGAQGTSGDPGGSGGGYTEGGGGTPPPPVADAGNGTAGQGAGGSYPQSHGGGGGGAGGTMPNPYRDASHGGDGLELTDFSASLIGVPSLSPLNSYFAGGGGGGINSNVPNNYGTAGAGGGGRGNQWPNSRPGEMPATVNSGGGGGGGVAHENGSPGGGAGGSGIVVIRYPA